MSEKVYVNICDTKKCPGQEIRCIALHKGIIAG